MIRGLCASYDELPVERIDYRSAHKIRECDVPALGAVGVEREQLAQVLHKIVDAIRTDVGLREDVEGVLGWKGPYLIANGRVSREHGVHVTVRPDGGLQAGNEMAWISTKDCEHGRAIKAHCAQMIVGVKI
jgi:hypothetical protein